ncbi:hypothetical protein BGX26_002901 [Mortierella sp. AD094]|nr:hypothetical protein BGX26_002901 [Mortierella sp. AD094]
MFATSFGNVSISLCLQVPLNERYDTFPNISLEYVTNTNINPYDESFYGISTFYASGVKLYLPDKTNVLLVSHFSKLLYRGPDGVYLMALKAWYNSTLDGDPTNLFTDTFNNSKLLLSVLDPLIPSNSTVPSALVHMMYKQGDFLAINVMQKICIPYFVDISCCLRVRFLLSVYLVTDDGVFFDQAEYPGGNFITTSNSTDRTDMTKDILYKFTNTSMLDAFNDPPSSDLFMYALANAGRLYGMRGANNLYYFASLLLAHGKNKVIPSLSLDKEGVRIVEAEEVDDDGAVALGSRTKLMEGPFP